MKKHAALLLMLMVTHAAVASDFKTGPVLQEFGRNVEVDADFIVPRGAKLQVAFDVAEGAAPGEVSRKIESAARFVNMHVRAGMNKADIKVAVVVHGSASFDVVSAARYSEKHATENGSRALIAQLLQQGVRIIICGQSAAYNGIKKTDLLPGVELALSAMTAHAVLQQQNYTLNPF